MHPRTQNTRILAQILMCMFSDGKEEQKALLVGLEPTPARLEVWRATIAPQELEFYS